MGVRIRVRVMGWSFTILGLGQWVGVRIRLYYPRVRAMGGS